MELGQKLQFVRQAGSKVKTAPEENVKYLRDLLIMCGDNDFDVVIKAVKELADCFIDIIPSYRIR